MSQNAQQTLEDKSQMNEQRIKKMLKKYNLSKQQRRYIIKQLNHRAILKKFIRNNLCTQNQTTNKIYCLISGSVQIYYKLANQISLITQQSHQKRTELTLKIQKHNPSSNSLQNYQKISFLTIQNQYQILNDQVILQYLQKEQKYIKKPLVEDEDENQLEKSREEIKDMKKIMKYYGKNKKNVFKNKYFVVVTSSQCQYIELTFQQAKILLRERIEEIKEKEFQRDRIVQQRKNQLKLSQKNNQKKQFVQKLYLPNIKLKNIHPANQILQTSEQLKRIQSEKIIERSTDLKEQYTRKFNIAGNDIKSNQASFQPMSRVKSLSLMASRNLMGNQIQANQKPNKIDQNDDLSLFKQNQKILQRYRAQKRGKQSRLQNQNRSLDNEVINKKSNTKNNPSIQKTTSLIKNHPPQRVKDKIFKEHLKTIIKKKLKFQKKHGQIIRQFLHGQKDQQIVNEYDNRLNSQRYDKPNNSKNFIVQNQLKKPKINTLFGAWPNSEKNKRPIQENKYSYHNIYESQHDLQSDRHQNSKNVNSTNDLDKMRRRLQQQKLFIQLQNIDNFFNKVN